MAALESEQMKCARDLVVSFEVKPADAARQSGITKQAIYMAPWYKEWKAKQAKGKRK